jgi:VIT1/CCC1 family predicted Fe2+/Mn2+ transporter
LPSDEAGEYVSVQSQADTEDADIETKKRIAKGVMRVAFWGALAMGITAGVGRLFGAVV